MSTMTNTSGKRRFSGTLLTDEHDILKHKRQYEQRPRRASICGSRVPGGIDKRTGWRSTQLPLSANTAPFSIPAIYEPLRRVEKSHSIFEAGRQFHHIRDLLEYVMFGAIEFLAGEFEDPEPGLACEDPEMTLEEDWLARQVECHCSSTAQRKYEELAEQTMHKDLLLCDCGNDHLGQLRSLALAGMELARTLSSPAEAWEMLEDPEKTLWLSIWLEEVVRIRLTDDVLVAMGVDEGYY